MSSQPCLGMSPSHQPAWPPHQLSLTREIVKGIRLLRVKNNLLLRFSFFFSWLYHQNSPFHTSKIAHGNKTLRASRSWSEDSEKEGPLRSWRKVPEMIGLERDIFLILHRSLHKSQTQFSAMYPQNSHKVEARSARAKLESPRINSKWYMRYTA